jgi:NAD(P)-dependent dehydrogenase (short-subunit alcohol dehydrogenase family)
MLSGRVAIVTGAGQRTGTAVAKAVAAKGAAVVGNDLGVQLDRKESGESPAELVVREIIDMGGHAIANHGDVGDFEAAHILVDAAISAFDRLDILVNVAGIVRDRMLFNMTEEEWDAVIRVHLKGTFNTTRHASRYWHDTEGDGRGLVNFTPGAALYGSPIQPNYAAAKMGIVGLTLSCANALSRFGICSNAVSPTAWTRMTEIMPRGRETVFRYPSHYQPRYLEASVPGGRRP